MRKKKTELKWVKDMFVGFLNKKLGSDYEVKFPTINNDPDLPDVDGILISQSGKFTTLNLQLTTDCKRNKEIKSYLIFNPDLIYESIKAKADKYEKQNKNISNLILLIQGDMTKYKATNMFTDNYLRKCSQYKFKGIYYLSPPKYSGGRNQCNYEESFVIPIKEIVVA